MVHNSFDWNFPEKKCLEIIHTTLINILKKQKDHRLPLNELIFMFNNRTKHHKIHQRKKFNNFVKYIKINHGSTKQFFDDYSWHYPLQYTDIIWKCIQMYEKHIMIKKSHEKGHSNLN